jgi:Family of unknown function (DUF6262)
MTRSDNSDHLRRAATARHNTTMQRARAAVDELDRTGQPVTITTIARAAHVSRSWLYEQSDLRATIAQLATTTVNAHLPAIPAAQRATAESLRQRLDTARHELARLRTENSALREQLARTLGRQRAHP